METKSVLKTFVGLGGQNPPSN